MIAAASWVVQRWVMQFAMPTETASVLVPVLLGIGLVVVAADLFAHDLATDRLASLALLPVSSATLWTARMLALAAVGVVLFAWTWGCQMALVSAFGKPGAQWLPWTEVRQWEPRSTAGLGLAIAAASLTALVSSVGVGGVRAAAVGAGCAALAFFGLRSAGATVSPAIDWTHVAYSAAITCAAASLIGFVRGRTATGPRWRPTLWSSSVLLAVGLPSTAWAVATLRADEVRPGGPGVYVESLSVASDARHLLVTFDRSDRCAPRSFLLRIDDGRLWDVKLDADAADLPRWSPEEWSALHRVRESRMTLFPPEGWRCTDAPRDKSKFGTWRLVRVVDGRECPVGSRGRPVAWATGEVLCVDEEGALVAVDLETRARRVVAALGASHEETFSRDLRYVLFSSAGEKVLLDRASGREVCRVPRGSAAGWAGYHASTCYFVITEGWNPPLRTRLLDPRSGREIVLARPVWVHGWSRLIAPLPDGRLVAGCGGEIVLFDADGNLIRTILAKQR